jgi:hypothetical protein
MEILRGIQEKKNIVTEMKNSFDGLLSRLHLSEERIFVLGGMTIETSQIGRIGTEYPSTVEQLQKV